MAGTWLETAAHLVDHVIPPVPVRQWVISVPKRLRGFLADRPAAVAALTRIFIEEIERLLGAAAGVTSDASAPAAACPRLGAVSFLHRFGSALEAHVHLHVCATEGVFVPPADGARCDTPPAFLPARPINQADLAALGVWLVFYQEKVPDPFWAQGERDRHRLLTQTEPVPAAAAADMLAWENSGFSVDATCSDHAHRPQRAELFSELGAPAAGHTSGEHATGGCYNATHVTQKPRSHDTSRTSVGETHGPGGGEEFPLECPWVWWRYPAHCLHHGAGADPEDSHAPRRASDARRRSPGNSRLGHGLRRREKNADAWGCAAFWRTASGRPGRPVSLLKGSPSAGRPLRTCH